MTNSNFERVAASCIVSWEFSVISRDNSIWEQSQHKVTAHELFSCVLITTRLIKNYLIFLLIWHEIVLLAVMSWNCEILVNFQQYIDADVSEFYRGIIKWKDKNFSNRKWPILVNISRLDETCNKHSLWNKKIIPRCLWWKNWKLSGKLWNF